MQTATIDHKRNIALDIIRIFAMLDIFTFHFMGALGRTNSVFYGYKNGGWGSVGSTIFFVLSGFLLYDRYQEMQLCRREVLGFYKKRFLSIIPLQIVCFSVFFFANYILTRNLWYGGKGWKIIFSFFGIDGYMGMYGIQTYHIVGEWFTTIILLVYLLFPILLAMFKKLRWGATIIIAALYFLNIVFSFQTISPDASVFTGIFVFWTGMLICEYQKRIKEYKWPVVLAGILILVIVLVRLPQVKGSPLPWKNLLGISMFVLLYFLLSLVTVSSKVRICLYKASDMAFAFYLCHHYMIYRYIEYFPTFVQGNKRVFASWGVILVSSAVVSWILNMGVKRILFRFKDGV